MDTATRKALEKKIDSSGGKELAARKLGCSQSHLYMVLNGERVASRFLAARIEKKYAIPAAKVLGI